MALSYEQQKDISSKVQQGGRTILEKVIVYGFEGVKFVVNFIKDMLKQAFG